MVRWWLEHPNVPKEHVVARFMDVVWMGLENLRNDRLWEHSLRPEPFAAEPPGVPDSPAQRGEAPRSAGATASSHEPPAGAIGSGPFVAAGWPMSTASRRAARAAREEQILVVAERRFTESGYRAVSMDEIAKEVGLSKAMVYNYVGDKESLYLACFRRARQRLEGTIDAGAIEGDSWEERFRYGMLGVLAFVEANREPWLMVHEHVLDRKGPFAAEMQDMRAHMSRLITQHFAEARRDAGLALSGRGVELSAHAVLGAIEQVASWWLEECPEIPRSEIADGMVGVLYDGLGAAARPDGAPTARAR